jgi:hypothetical protein
MSTVNVVLGLKNSQFKQGLADSRKDVKRFKQEVGDGGGMMGALGKAFAGLAIADTIKQVVDYADNISDLSDRLGVGSESLQKWGKLAEQNGSSLEGVGKALGKLTVAREDALAGNTALIDTFRNLGISVDDLRSMSVDEIMAKIGRGSMNAADMVGVLGKEAVALRPTLESAAEGGLGKMSAMSADTIKTLGDAKDQIVGFAGMLKDKLGEALGWVINKWKTFNETLGATSAALSEVMKGSSWKDAWATSQKALDQMRAENAKPQAPKKPRDFDTSDTRAEQKRKLDDQAAKAQEEVAKAREEQRQAVDDALQKKSDDVQLKIWDRFKLSASARHAAERQDRRDERNQARADRQFARKFGDAELQRVRDLRDPVKQAEAAHKKALQTSEEKLAGIQGELSMINNKIDLPT